MNKLVTRNSLFDSLFDDMAPGFLMRPLHGDALPAASKIKIDVSDKTTPSCECRSSRVAKEDIDLS